MIGSLALVGYNGFCGKSARPRRPQDQTELLRVQVPQQLGVMWDINGAKFQDGHLLSNRGGRRLITPIT